MDKEEERIKITKTLTFTAIIAILIIIGTIIFNTYIKDDGANASNKYLILGNYLILQKTNTTYKQVEDINDDILKYPFEITDGNETSKNITMQFLNNQWYFFDKDYNEINMPKFRVATHNLDIKLADFETETITSPLDDEYITEFLSTNNIPNWETYRATLTTSDFDSDGNEEFIYTLSNYALAVTDYDQNGYIFIVKDDAIVNINDNDGKGPYTVMEILDLENDGKNEIIINKGSKDLKTFDSCYQIYTLKKDKLELKKDCE